MALIIARSFGEVYLVGDGVNERVAGSTDEVRSFNDRNDILIQTSNLPTPSIRWGEPPSQQAVRSLEEGFGRCKQGLLLTNDRTMAGTEPEGWCIIRPDGQLTLLANALPREIPGDWQVTWREQDRLQHPSGLVVMPARREGNGENGLMMIDIDP